MYIRITNGTVATHPYSVGQLRRDNPNTSFPKRISEDMLESYGVLPLTLANKPDIDNRTQKLQQDAAPFLVDGYWTISWTVSSKTVEETQSWDDSAASGVRTERNTLLAATDYFALTDVPMNAEMKTYRQALRDITAQEGFPNDVGWPSLPE